MGSRITINRHALTELRLMAGYSVTELASRANLSHGTVIDIENGRRQGSAATLRKLADALSVRPKALLGTTDPDDREAVA